MEHSTIQTVGVLGTGVIGASWTVLFLSKGLKVIASDPAPEAERKLRAFIDASWSNVCKADPAAPASPPHSALTFVDEWQTPFQGVDFVQENGPERLQYKEEVFRSLATSTRPGVVLASSSSGLPSSQYAGSQDGATRTLVGHPFNPPHLIPLVEVVPNSRTSSKAVDAAMHFYRSLDRSPVLVKGESPGFITNRLQAALVHEAYSLVSRGLISASDLDSCVSNGLALRWALQGPFLTKVLGGGGGASGFRHHLAHVGAAAALWREDMTLHAFVSTPEANQTLIEAVDDELALLGAEKVETLAQDRDNFLVELVQLKDKLAKQ